MILVIGDILLDVFILSELQAAEQGEGIVLRGGGSAANTAAWIGAAGAEVTFVGCVGDDPRGKMLVNELAQTGVRFAGRAVQQLETGAVAIEVGEEGERMMRSARGANQALAPDDILRVKVGDVTWVHLSGYALFGPYGLELLTAAAAIAARHGATLSFDPASPGVIRKFGGNRLIDSLKQKSVAVLLPNLEEASVLSGVDAAEAAALRLSADVPAVCVKAGAVGASWACSGAAGTVRARAVAPRDTTGAGDAFNAGAIVALARGESCEEACTCGNATAARVLAGYGGRPYLPTC